MRNRTCIFHTGFLLDDQSSLKYRTKTNRLQQTTAVSEAFLLRKINETLEERLKTCDLFGCVKGRLDTARKISATGLLYYQRQPPEGADKLLN